MNFLSVSCRLSLSLSHYSLSDFLSLSFSLTTLSPAPPPLSLSPSLYVFTACLFLCGYMIIHTYLYPSSQALLGDHGLTIMEQPPNLFAFPAILTSLLSTHQVTRTYMDQNTIQMILLQERQTEMISPAVCVVVP